MDIESKFLGEILTEQEKKAILNSSYRSAEELLDSQMFMLSRIMRNIILLMQQKPWYGISGILKDEHYDVISEAAFDEEENGQFFWEEDTEKAISIFIDALADPAFRRLFDCLLASFKEMQQVKEFEEEIKQQQLP